MINISPTHPDLRDVTAEFKKLRELGVDLSPVGDLVEQTQRERALHTRHRELQDRRQTAPTAVRAEAMALAGAPATPDTWESLSREIQITGEAINEIRRTAWATLTARGDKNLDLLRPVYYAAAQRLIDLAPPLEGINTIDEAARANRTAEWLAAESAHATVKAVQRIHLQWLADGVVRNHGARAKHDHRKLSHYNPTEFHYEHPDTAATMIAGRRDPIGEARRLATAGVALRTITEVDALHCQPNEVPRQSGATHDGDALQRDARRNQQARNGLGVNVFQ